MSSKIEWYREVLALEPNSMVFFPLAKLLAEEGRADEGIDVLVKGLDRHPGDLESRMLLVQLLTDLGREDEVHKHLSQVVSPMADYPAFWKAWARSMPEEQRELAVFLMLVAENLSGNDIRWTDVVFEGMSSLSSRLVGAPLPPPGDLSAAIRRADMTTPDEEYDGVLDPDDEVEVDSSTVRTRTMADLLAAQGETDAALDIYRELMATADGADKVGLEAVIAELEGAEPVAPEVASECPEDDSKSRLISALETLAERFEARAGN